MSTWHASVTFLTERSLSADSAFDLIDALEENGASMSIATDLSGGTVTICVDAQDALTAATEATHLVTRHTDELGPLTVSGVSVLTSEAFDQELAEPMFPEVVSYAEIAELGGFSRQRARQLASSDSFPAAVITTAQGPLYSKHAAQQWLNNRTAKPGRPAQAKI